MYYNILNVHISGILGEVTETELPTDILNFRV